MIGLGRVAAVCIAIVTLVPLLGAGGPGPGAEIAGRRLVVERAELADSALDQFEEAVQPGLEVARAGAADVVSGDEPPGDDLEQAASMLEAAVPAAERASRAVAALEGARQALGVTADSVALPRAAPELASIAEQLSATGSAADRFVTMRQRADRVLVALDTALAALDRDDIVGAQAALTAARADHAELTAWETGLVTLPVWLDATAALIDATERLTAAVEAGDAAAAEEAADDVARLGAGAASADRALRIAMGEGGSAVTAAPLSRLADLLRQVAEARVAVAEILHSVRR